MEISIILNVLAMLVLSLAVFIGNLMIALESFDRKFNIFKVLDEIKYNLDDLNVLQLFVVLFSLPMLILTAIIHLFWHYKPFKRK